MTGADDPAFTQRAFTIVGVVRSVAMFRMAASSEASVYLPGNAAMAKTSLVARVAGDPQQVRQTLLTRLTAIDPNMGSVMTMKSLAGLEAYVLQIVFWLTLVLGSLALALTVSGLFSVLSYLVEQRAREIGVRLALGATARDIGMLMLSQTIRPVGIGLLAGSGLAAGVAIVLLSTSAAAQIASIVHVLDPVAYAGSLAIILAVCALAALVPTRRAVRIDPTESLRQE